MHDSPPSITSYKLMHVLILSLSGHPAPHQSTFCPSTHQSATQIHPPPPCASAWFHCPYGNIHSCTLVPSAAPLCVPQGFVGLLFTAVLLVLRSFSTHSSSLLLFFSTSLFSGDTQRSATFTWPSDPTAF